MNMLAAVLVLTILPPTVRLSKAVIEHCCFLISQQLGDSGEVSGALVPQWRVLTEIQMSLTAAHCAKTLVIASAAGNPALQQCARLLLPGMIECVAKVAALEGESSEIRVQIIGEIWKAFAALFTSATEETRESANLLGNPIG